MVAGLAHPGDGHVGSAPTAFGFMGLGGIPLLGNGDVLRWLLVLVPLPLAGIGVWRLLQPFGSRNAAVVGTIAYLANPVAYNAYARGSWSALVAFAAAPWIFQQIAAQSRRAPFRAEFQGGSFAHRAIGLGLLLALVAAFVPFAFALVWITVAGVVLGSLVSGDGRGLVRLLGITAVASVIAAVLNLPWFVTFVRSEATWSSFVGQGASEGNGLGVGDLLRFQTGPMGGKIVGYGLVACAVFSLVLAQGQRFAWAVRCWFVALAAWGVVWAGEQGWFDRPLPYPGVLLTMAALALSVSAGARHGGVRERPASSSLRVAAGGPVHRGRSRSWRSWSRSSAPPPTGGGTCRAATSARRSNRSAAIPSSARVACFGSATARCSRSTGTPSRTRSTSAPPTPAALRSSIGGAAPDDGRPGRPRRGVRGRVGQHQPARSAPRSVRHPLRRRRRGPRTGQHRGRAGTRVAAPRPRRAARPRTGRRLRRIPHRVPQRVVGADASGLAARCRHRRHRPRRAREHRPLRCGADVARRARRRHRRRWDAGGGRRRVPGRHGRRELEARSRR